MALRTAKLHWEEAQVIRLVEGIFGMKHGVSLMMQRQKATMCLRAAPRGKS